MGQNDVSSTFTIYTRILASNFINAFPRTLMTKTPEPCRGWCQICSKRQQISRNFYVLKQFEWGNQELKQSILAEREWNKKDDGIMIVAAISPINTAQLHKCLSV